MIFSSPQALLDLNSPNRAVSSGFLGIINAALRDLLIPLSKAIIANAESVRCNIRAHTAADAGRLINVSFHKKTLLI